MIMFSSLLKKVKERKTLFNFLSSSLFSIPISLITSFISLRNIDPVLIGTWTAVTTFQGYAGFIGLGVINGMNRELPLSFGRNEKEKAFDFASNGLGYILFQSSLYFIFLIYFLFYYSDNLNYLLSIIALFIKVIIGIFNVYLEGTYRSNSDFDKISKINWITSIVRLLVCPLVFFGFKGFLIYMVVFDFAKFFLLFRWRPIKVKARFNFSVLKNLITVGFPIFIVTYLGSLIDTIPRIFILKNGGEIALGLFSPVIMLLGIFEQFSGAMSSYLYPKLAFRYGSGESIKSICKLNLRAIIIVFFCLLLLTIPLIFLLNYFVVIFPKYKGSISYLKIAVFLAPLFSYNLSGIIFVIFKKFKSLYILHCIKAILLFFLIFVIDKLFLSDPIYTVLVSLIVTFMIILLIGILMINTIIHQNENACI